jgi:hypothetical protein
LTSWSRMVAWWMSSPTRWQPMPRRTGLETTRARSSWAGSKSLWRKPHPAPAPCHAGNLEHSCKTFDLHSNQPGQWLLERCTSWRRMLAATSLRIGVNQTFWTWNSATAISNLKPHHVLGPSLGSGGQSPPRSLVAAGRFPAGTLKICLRRRRDGRQLPSPRGAVGVEFAQVQYDQVQETQI